MAFTPTSTPKGYILEHLFCILIPSVLFFPMNPVGATLAGIPLTTISKSYDWGGVFVALELASLFCGCLLIGARNVSRHMVEPSKLE